MNSIKIDGKYQNRHSIKMSMNIQKTKGITKDYIKKKDTIPPFEIPKKKIDIQKFENKNSFVWLGHSTILSSIDGVSFIVDPMLSNRASPLKCLGPKRFDGSLVDIDDLPKIDVVLITHNHYDHLDKDTILALQDKVEKIFVPLDNAKILTKWGVNHNKIQEFDWYEEFEYKNVKFIFCPTQHFSGRGLSDRDKYLWGSWAVFGSNSIYISGDSGYNDHFKDIGKRFKSFDIVCMECGAYNKNWSEIHMHPSQSVQASVDLNAKVMLPMHWAGFDLSTHAWDEPISLAKKEAKEKEVVLTTPMIGQVMSFENPIEKSSWWLEK